ncbi:peroxidase 41-like [Cucurbita pepo subsp. pepo]|uniref:peroxidase 41-like n=1 Tax=Cucurbita pepo subsp. pepo TaxID=3664 RepID=UPI000C9D6BD5|nr:peroxidase 41-like [Cucurbita pepo subsp. pepo]
MAFLHSPALLLLLFLSLPFSVQSQLSLDYYHKTCPDFAQIVHDTVARKHATSPVTAAASMRLLFSDCLVGGCDGSVLVSSNVFNHAERDAEVNRDLPGDAFDVVTRAKITLELSCPGIVSCSDVLAQATRDLIAAAGGPSYKVELGREDSLVSKVSDVEGNIPKSNQSIDELIKLYTAKGFTIQEMVALYGGRTIGFSNCKEFSDRLFNFSKNTPTDPEINLKYAEALKKSCADYEKNPGSSAYSDPVTPGKFDNAYYQNLLRGMGLLASDHALVKDPRTKKFVEMYAGNQALFFKDFGEAMEKMSVREVKTGGKGEVRTRCDAFNSINHH